jgi:hypothetical protein
MVSKSGVGGQPEVRHSSGVKNNSFRGKEAKSVSGRS